MISYKILILGSFLRPLETLNFIKLEINATFENVLNISCKTIPTESLFSKVVSKKAPVMDYFVVRFQNSKNWLDRWCFPFKFYYVF